MTIKEKEKLVVLAEEIVDTLDIIYSPLSSALLTKLLSTEDNDVLDVLIKHLKEAKIYEIYNRFDREAATKDVEKLLNVIHSIQKGQGNDSNE
jgi:serine/threonine-protein kinase RIO1